MMQGARYTPPPEPQGPPVPDELRFKEAMGDAMDDADLEAIVRAALAVNQAYYLRLDDKVAQFMLRKALEGIWGDDLPHLGVHPPQPPKGA